MGDRGDRSPFALTRTRGIEMQRDDVDWRTRGTTELMEAIVGLEDVDQAMRFFRDLCTLGELHDMAQRWAVVRLLDEGLHYGEISRRTGASTATITRIASWFNHGEGGYRAALARMRHAKGTGASGAATRNGAAS